ncbi:GPI ethanolamine phosphate transferase 2 isoform X2 [Magnolia sinica]|uniref:GPI ethanolamine phosphate transferase 2 isoform X2 n=1 Tax=Magnolia sinica TaxID=86752 RepID=UPI00265912A1|nr:GPI ethanolamine phosphate transferase 2 isoform X2 [Magnolia sinica]
MSSLTCARLATWTIAAVLLQVLGLSLFALGFFPVKPTLSGVSGPESYQMPTCDSTLEDGNKTALPPDHLRSLYKEMSGIPPSFDRLILMVVDGLPAEFVLGKGDQPPSKAMMEAMPYTQSLLSNGRAVGYHAKAAPPTVTMPRLKAMVSGAIGGFLDVAFNFNTQAFLDDNLLGQFCKIGWKMVMLGDETWIKLFPGLFMRQDGVSSFYVKDTVEVDHNVSRHLEVELVTADWNLLILHYLGLDHVGHIGGRYSTLMAPKLKEMDEVIKKIHMSTILHQNNLDKRTLLMIVSDHGMTDNGNHGGSSYEETDSLALFIGLQFKVPDSALATHNNALQVDIAPTLALLFGVPIPKNNVGVLIARVLDSLTDEQWLRALELNSWQLLRLLQAQIPGLLCGNSACDGFHHEKCLAVSRCNGCITEKFCCLYSKAVALHSSWKFQSNSTDDLRTTIAAYYEFLTTSTEWLSRRVTDKPLVLLASGIAIMLISCVMLLSLLFRLCSEIYLTQMQCLPNLNGCTNKWRLDEAFVLIAVLIHVLSLGASSMVEEEQYIWHFLTSSLFLIFLRVALQSLPVGPASSLCNEDKGEKSFTICQSSKNSKNNDTYFQVCPVIVVLICGRILRGWHQGGVNWTHLPDISKWLEDAGILGIKSFQIASVFLVVSFGSFALFLVKSMRNFVLVVQIGVWISASLVLFHIMEYENHAVVSTNSIAQIIYATVGMTVMGTALVSPWITPVSNRMPYKNTEPVSTSLPIDIKVESLLVGIRDSAYLNGRTYIICWCLLQLLLQQPINAMPVLLLLLQILASMNYFSTDGSHHKQWVEGISSRSTVLAGVLVFMITYASPLLFLLAMTMYIPMTEMKYLRASRNEDLGCHLRMMVGIPCLLPLGLNSVVLTAFTIILLLMRNHLFVWSVFSPKYLYVCTATVSIYVGVSIIAATGVYTRSIFFFRTKMFSLMEGTT